MGACGPHKKACPYHPHSQPKSEVRWSLHLRDMKRWEGHTKSTKIQNSTFFKKKKKKKNIIKAIKWQKNHLLSTQKVKKIYYQITKDKRPSHYDSTPYYFIVSWFEASPHFTLQVTNAPMEACSHFFPHVNRSILTSFHHFLLHVTKQGSLGLWWLKISLQLEWSSMSYWIKWKNRKKKKRLHHD